MLYEAMDNKPLVMWYFLVVTLTSVAGSYIGYLIGQRWGRQLLDRFAKQKHVAKLEALTTKYGTVGIFIAAFSPIPYKALAWIAGIGEMDKRQFIIAGLWGRGLRFGIQGIVIGVWGDQLLNLLSNPLIWAVLTVVSLVVFLPAIRWWDSLLEEEE